MAQISYQVILSTDGKHTVIVTSDDPVAARDAVAWARETYDELVDRYGLKHEQYKNGEYGNKEAAPICAAHNVPMVRQEGKYGPFWSCHQREADGSFCSYRPKEA